MFPVGVSVFRKLIIHLLLSEILLLLERLGDIRDGGRCNIEFK